MLNSLQDNIELTITSNSIVPMMIALSRWLMPEVVYSVAFMKIYMVHYAMFGIAIMSRSIIHVHVKPTRTYGTSTLFAMVAKHCLALLAFFDALKLKTSHGFLSIINMHSLMTNNLLLDDHGLPIFNPHEYTVLRQSVHHVVLSLLGQNSPLQSHQPISWSSWRPSTPQKSLAQISSALTRHALFFAPALPMEAGIHGGTQLGSSWTHTTTSITVFKTISVGNGAILLHSMGHNQTW